MAKKNTYDASSITVLEGLEAVRKRPGMYIGSVSRKGLNHLIYEIVDNAVDEHLAGFCTNIRVTLEADGSATVEDNGRGIPVGMHEKGMSAERLVFTTLHAGGKFDSSVYKTSGGLHGVGSSVVNALSAYLDVKISRDGYIHHDCYERGIPAIELEEGLLPKLGKTKATGTLINFLPDPEIFKDNKTLQAERLQVYTRDPRTCAFLPWRSRHRERKRGIPGPAADRSGGRCRAHDCRIPDRLCLDRQFLLDPVHSVGGHAGACARPRHRRGRKRRAPVDQPRFHQFPAFRACQDLPDRLFRTLHHEARGRPKQQEYDPESAGADPCPPHTDP